MGRNRMKQTTPPRFGTWKEYDEQVRKEHRRYQDELNKLSLKYGVGGKLHKPRVGWEGRVDGRFKMAEAGHDAALDRLERRQPEAPRPKGVA